MLHAPPKKHKEKRASIRAAARALQISPGHLSRVLRGERDSKTLKRRYALFLKQEAAR